MTGVPLYTDARHYAAHGIPVVLYGAGPRTILEANAHNANENIRLSDLRAATKIIALDGRDRCAAPEARPPTFVACGFSTYRGIAGTALAFFDNCSGVRAAGGCRPCPKQFIRLTRDFRFRG